MGQPFEGKKTTNYDKGSFVSFEYSFFFLFFTKLMAKIKRSQNGQSIKKPSVARGTWLVSLNTVRKSAYVQSGCQEYEILSQYWRRAYKIERKNKLLKCCIVLCTDTKHMLLNLPALNRYLPFCSGLPLSL